MNTRRNSAAREAEFLKQVTTRIKDTAAPLGVKKSNESLKDLVKERKNYGAPLLKAGAVLLIIPDPITDAAAIPVLAAGKILSSRQGSNVKEVYGDLAKSLSSLKSISSSL